MAGLRGEVRSDGVINKSVNGVSGLMSVVARSLAGCLARMQRESQAVSYRRIFLSRSTRGPSSLLFSSLPASLVRQFSSITCQTENVSYPVAFRSPALSQLTFAKYNPTSTFRLLVCDFLHLASAFASPLSKLHFHQVLP